MKGVEGDGDKSCSVSYPWFMLRDMRMPQVHCYGGTRQEIQRNSNINGNGIRQTGTWKGNWTSPRVTSTSSGESLLLRAVWEASVQ